VIANQDQMDKAQPQSRVRIRWVIGVYAVLLLVSHGFQIWTGSKDHLLLPGPDRPSTQISNRDHFGEPIADEQLAVVYDRWDTESAQSKTPVLLMHGAPGMGTDFRRLGPLLNAEDRVVLAPDLIGFSASGMGSNVSYRVQARYMFEFLDKMGVQRVHLVGWSNGGGVGLRMSDLDPDRVASLTMLASVGAQETEGSGSYFFEHVKYAVGLGIAGVVPELIPHFGLLGSRDLRIGWLWSFWDSDQRELTRIMPTIQTPTMILHGRDDPLVAASGAEKHHEMMPTSRLVMLDASHFMPFMQAQETAGYLNEFFDRHDEPGVEPQTDYLNLAPVPVRYGADAMLHWFGGLVKSLPWWMQLIGLILLTRYLPHVTIVLAAVMVVMMRIDLAVAILGLLVGRTWWLVCGANALERPLGAWRWVRGILFVVPAMLVGMIIAGWAVGLSEQIGFVGLTLGCIMTLVAVHGLRLIITWGGRQRIKGWFRRAINHEYWPRMIIYAPVLWWGVKRMFRRGLQPLTAVNPGYSYDGGVQGESKIDLNTKLGDGDEPAESVLHCVLIDESTAESRTRSALLAIDQDQRLHGYPVIAKPDEGEQGRGVKLLKTLDDVRAYCESSGEPFVLQQFHPGPHELGVLWMRHEEAIRNPDYDGPTGYIYAITIKHFPVLRGDGKHTLRKLILSHKRHRAQPSVFFEHNKTRLNWIPDKGQKVRLGIAGNHAQGAKFTDGAYLITPELTDRINEIIDGFDQRAGSGFDIGRFDLRCESLDELAQGKGFGIVELNGLTSEPTNLYDPKRSLFWAWRVLLGHWTQLEKLAEARIATKTGEPVDDRTWDRIRNALIRSMI
jgi:pimeloyl-ACP methyl ester carboxylesterase